MAAEDRSQNGSVLLVGRGAEVNERVRSAGLEYLAQLDRSDRNARDREFRTADYPKFDPLSAPVSLIAFYLPQLYPDPDNDKRWGRGGTEWISVVQAKPQFPGHYQPHLPADLGFYDLRNEQVIEQQVELARRHGIGGFCILDHWSAEGRRLFGQPLDILYRRKDIDFKFCLCWSGDRSRPEAHVDPVLSSQSATQYIDDALRYMDDPRYLRVGGRPIIVVQQIGLLPNSRATLEHWRERAQERIGTGLFLVGPANFNPNTHPVQLGLDAVLDCPPHGIVTDEITDKIVPFSSSFTGRVDEYIRVIAPARRQLASYECPVIPSVFPGKDDTARHGGQGHCYIRTEPRLYGYWLAEAVLHAVDKPVDGESLVFIDAWNDWAGGAHLEPDQRYGHAFLQMSAEALRPYLPLQTVSSGNKAAARARASLAPEKDKSKTRVASIIHAFYPDALEELLSSIPEEAREGIFITLPEDPPAALLSVIAKKLQNPRLYFYPNWGRDIRPFLGVLQTVRAHGYAYFVKVHTKKSTHRLDGDEWRSSLISPLLELLREKQLQKFLDENAEIALVAGETHLLNAYSYIGGAGNIAWLRRLCLEFDIRPPEEDFHFAAGSMFAGRVSSFLPIATHPFLADAFENEAGQMDGTLAHALERFFGLFVKAKGQMIAGARLADGKLILTRDFENAGGSYLYAPADRRRVRIG
jgi:lipopolysaccharide biosynthesis protein